MPWSSWRGGGIPALSEPRRLGLDEHKLQLLLQSKHAFHMAESDAYADGRIARAINGEVVTDSESDNPEDYVHLQDPLSEEGRVLVKKRRTAIQRRIRRMKAKAIAEQRFLTRKTPKRSKVSKVLLECPDVGKTIEDFVIAGNVGADQWRRTGVLTFDGNTNLPKKITYGRIQKHLEKLYQQHFSNGTVVQLCVPRNKRRRSSAMYQGVAKVTTRRARKGFTLKYNPDTHWSCSFYKGLNVV